MAAAGSAAAASWGGFGAAGAVRRPSGANRGNRSLALGLLASDLAARPDEIIGAAGGRRQRLALDQRARRQRVDRGGARARAAEQLIGADRGRHQRQDRPCERARRRLAGLCIGVGRCGLGRQCDRRRARRQQPGHFALDIMRELAGAGLGEIDAVSGAQPPDLAFEVRALAAGSGRLRRRSRPRHRHR